MIIPRELERAFDFGVAINASAGIAVQREGRIITENAVAIWRI